MGELDYIIRRRLEDAQFFLNKAYDPYNRKYEFFMGIATKKAKFAVILAKARLGRGDNPNQLSTIKERYSHLYNISNRI